MFIEILRRGENVVHHLKVSLEEMYNGASRSVSLTRDRHSLHRWEYLKMLSPAVANLNNSVVAWFRMSAISIHFTGLHCSESVML